MIAAASSGEADLFVLNVFCRFEKMTSFSALHSSLEGSEKQKNVMPERLWYASVRIFRSVLEDA